MFHSLGSHAKELKQQGAVEAAQDHNTEATAQDAEKVLIEESIKGGAAAFQFDPNATPQEKAAQAGAQVPAGFHRKKKSGVGIATDIDDGTPGKYDLPPPSTDGALPATSTPEGKKSMQANGAPLEDEYARDRVGWAPRFGTGDAADDEGETLLDHQTFLEGKLDDKFFGDWYHNTGVIIFACLSSWVIALLGGGLGWLFLVMATCGTYYRTSIRRVRRNFRDDLNRELAKAKLETDTESLEWINSFLVKFWPIYAPELCRTIIASVDQVLSTSTPAFLDSLRMRTFTLGTKPPRMEHVKTYPKAEDDIVLMDWKFSFTPTDTMDLTARQLKNKINPKVVLEIRIGKAMISKGLDVIVEDFAFSGLMRVKVKLQLPFPHIEKVDICFLGQPEIDYVCKPLGGDTLGFDINFIPGLETFIKEQIHGNLQPMMYDPNVFPIEIAKILAGNPVDLAIGVVAVTIHGAHGLKNPDKFSGTPDPYTAVSLNSRESLGQTKTIKENANPRWNETLYIIITSFTDTLTMQVYDWNEFRKDKELGTATFALDQLEQDTEHENLQLEVMANGKPRGQLQADVRFFPVLEGRKLEDGTLEPPPESNTGIARITVEQAKELDGSISLVGALNPYAVLLLNNKEIHITKKLKRTNNPVFPDPTKSVLITDRKKARLGLVIKDDRDLASDAVLGSYQIKMDDMIQLMDKGQEWFNLHGTKTGRVKLMLDWKPVGIKGITGSGGYVTPIGVMRIHFKNARDVRNFETIGKSDTYARVLLSGIEKGRTVTFKNNLNPDWDEVIYVPMHSTKERLTLEVLDQEKLGKDRTLGSVEVPASDYIRESETGAYEVHDRKTPMSEGLRINGRGQAKGKLNYTMAFYPTLNVVDPEEEEEELQEEAEVVGKPSMESKGAKDGKVSLDATRSSVEGSQQSAEVSYPPRVDSMDRGTIDTALANGVTNGEKETSKATPAELLVAKPREPKIRLGPEDLTKYECGLLVFKIVQGTFAHSDVQLEVLMDDMVFPSYTTSKARQRSHKFGETGDAFVRELEVSQITLRLTEKTDNKGEGDQDHVIARLKGSTLTTLQQCLYKPTELTMKGADGALSKVTVSLKYLPVKMQLDPSESINNMGTLRVDVLDAADLPSADRNGYSDPYCKFRLNGKEVFKTKVQKKTLHPAWNEFFEVQVNSRTAAEFKCDVYDWDFGDKADQLGTTAIDLQSLEPFQTTEMCYALDGKSGTLRLKLLFKPDYVQRSRQGSSTFSGTFAPAGKVVGAPIKGVGKGASFLKRGFTSKSKGGQDEAIMDANGSVVTSINGDVVSDSSTPQGTPSRPNTVVDGQPTTPTSAQKDAPHNRTRSFGSTFSVSGGTSKGASTGTASLTIIAANDYPPSADVRVYVKTVGPKGGKEVHKTKSVKSPTGKVEYSAEHETFNVACSADTQFQVVVKDHGLFGGEILGDGLFFLADQGSGAIQSVKAGPGVVVLQSQFTPSGGSSADSLRPVTSNGRDSPDSKRGIRRSLLSKRDFSGKQATS
ncbi:hypothetical protein EPUS_02981 [Endocarpon pusillum Z07020]|uniref:Tricalbin n=1 Tax=Endocarpon pusillum (strain Z07020 / HMAS-L-300199) TaxID=1263415 RepID=U1HSL6_ENDPU|nr:uncharacterized protein EPUS_02981 [Endocarpon pusillum Z07020]ERF72189.1 hypothetical protein EPUS_02981 [Endocarpon pusillum Z07020]